MLAAVWLIVACAIPGCVTEPAGFSKATQVMTKRFYKDTSVTRRMQTFRQYSINDQYDLFIFGNQYRHPPAQYLAKCFALNGAAGVELLRAKLPHADDDLTVRDIVRLLAEIDAMRMYDVAGDKALMVDLTARVGEMKDLGWKESTERRLAKIGREREEEAGFAPSCGPAPTSH